MEEKIEKFEKYFIILLPFFNESNLLADFLILLENKLKNCNNNFKLIFINDGSTDNSVEIIKNYKINSENLSIEITELNGNII